jgi:MFS family permease
VTPPPRTSVSARTGLIAVSGVWGVFWGAWGGLLPAVQDQAGASTSSLGLALVAIPVGAIPAMALTGWLARRRERIALVVAALAFASSIAALGPVSSPAQLGVVLVLVGSTSGALDVCLNLMTARVERETGRSLFQSVHAAFPVAVVVAAPLAGLARQAGVSLAVILSTVAVLVAAVGLSALRLPVGVRSSAGDATNRAVGQHPGRWLGLAIGAVAACMLIIENAVEQWSAVLLEDFRHAPPVVASSGPAVYYLALTAGRLTAQAFPRLHTRALLTIGAIGGGCSIALAALAPHAVPSLFFFALTGFAFGPLIPALLSHVANRDPDGSTVATVTSVSYSGFVASPLIVAMLSNWVRLPAAVALLGLLAVPLLAASLGRFFTSRGADPALATVPEALDAPEPR